MKKIFVAMLAVVMLFSLIACGQGGNTPANKPDEVSTTVLADEGHDAWVAHGQYKLADGTDNSWGGKDSALYEASSLKAISLADAKAISEGVYTALAGKDVKYLYTIDLLFGTNDAGWNAKFFKDGKMYNANGSYAFKVAQCIKDVDGDNTVYSEDQWISDPKTAHVEALTPDTLFMPAWQEAADEHGFSWADNPVVTGGAGLYTLVIAQYANASSAEQAGYGIALVLKEAKDGIAYEEIVEFVPADHTYGIVGSFNGWGENPDVAMTDNGDGTWTGEVELKAGDEFKVRADGNWDVKDWGPAEGGNFVAEADGTYVVTLTFDGANGTVNVTAK